MRRGGFEVRCSIEVEPGEVVALAGPNGTGKTTVLHAVAGLLPLADGEVGCGDEVWDGVESWVEPRRRGVGLVPQHHVLFGHLSVLENAAFGLRSRGMRAREARRVAGEWLDRLGVGDLAGRRAGGLSGGQAQRVAIARALAARPRAVLLDEPFTALDADSRPVVGRLVADALASMGVPALLVTHDAEEAGALAHRVVGLG